MNDLQERQRLLDLLDKLSQAVEDILLTGLTAASDASRQTLDQAFKEASQIGLLRLGSTLRVASEEIGAFIRHDESFSPKRLSFFLNRAWMLSQGMIHATTTHDEAQWQALTWSPQGKPVEALEVVTLGVSKRVVPSVFCAFEFRLRLITETDDLPENTPLIWSCVFPMKPGVELAPEGYLHLTQKQDFRAADFLDHKMMRIESAQVIEGSPACRITLDASSKVIAQDPFDEWDRYQSWDSEAALKRLQAYMPGPFDLDVELQEEVILSDWTIGEPIKKEHERMILYPIAAAGLLFHAPVPVSSDTVLRQAMDNLRQQESRSPLFALMHYEMCRLVLQPLAVIGEKGPTQLALSKTTTGAADLVRSMKF